MDAASDLARRGVRTAVSLHRASRAIGLAGSIDDGVGLGDVGTQVLEWAPLAAQHLALRATVFIGLLVPLEVTAGERFVGALGLVAHRHMRLDLLLVNHPS